MKFKFIIILLISFQLLTGCGRPARTDLDSCQVRFVQRGNTYTSIGYEVGRKQFMRVRPGKYRLTVYAGHRHRNSTGRYSHQQLFYFYNTYRLGFSYIVDERENVYEVANGTLDFSNSKSLLTYINEFENKKKSKREKKLDAEYALAEKQELTRLAIIAKKLGIKFKKEQDIGERREIIKTFERKYKEKQIVDEKKRIVQLEIKKKKEKEEYWRKVKKTNDSLEKLYKDIRLAQDNKLKEQSRLRKEYRKKHPFECSIKVTNGKLKDKYKKILEGSKKEFLKSLKTHDLTEGISLHGVYKYGLAIEYNDNDGKFVYTLNVSDFAPKESLIYTDRRSKFDYVNLNVLSAFSSIVSVWVDEVMKTTDDEVFKAVLNKNQTIIMVLNRKVDKKNVKVFIESEIYTKTNKLGFKNIMIYKTKDKEESFKAYSDHHLKMAKYFYFEKDKSSKDGQKYDKVERVFFAKQIAVKKKSAKK